MDAGVCDACQRKRQSAAVALMQFADRIRLAYQVAEANGFHGADLMAPTMLLGERRRIPTPSASWLGLTEVISRLDALGPPRKKWEQPCRFRENLTYEGGTLLIAGVSRRVYRERG
jgi:hypothetical protein